MTNDGRFQKGERRSPSTEFKKGQHWRSPQLYWQKEWLYTEYVEKGRSTSEIAADFQVTDANVVYFLKKHRINRRSVSEARAIKHWGQTGESNPMYGRTGENNANWRGGITPERQSVYASQKWKTAVSQVWKRDKARCQRCGNHHDQVDEMHVHHITSFQVVELRTELSNLILLCHTCHNWVHSKDNTKSEFIVGVHND